MEDVISNIENETKRLCDFLGINYTLEMLNFMDRMRVEAKKNRYKGLDKGQIGLWKNWNKIYDEFFSDNKYPIIEMFKKVEYLVTYFNYETGNYY